MQSKANTVEDYLSQLPEGRRKPISTVRQVILDNLKEDFEEVMQYGMISYIVPLSRYPETYNNQPLAYISLASQKNYMSLYLTNLYMDEDLKKWFLKEYEMRGEKLNMGKSCVRFRTINDLPLDLISQIVKRDSVESFIEKYENVRKR